MSCNLTLKKNGFKLTPQRRLILDFIHHTDGHLSAEEILDHVKVLVPGINKSTVYRTLDLLESLGCVVKSELNDRFIYHHAEGGSIIILSAGSAAGYWIAMKAFLSR